MRERVQRETQKRKEKNKKEMEGRRRGLGRV